jgi:hypothetical protein
MTVDKLGADAPWDEPLLISFNTVTAARAVLAVAAATCSLADAAPKLELAVDVERAVASRRVKLTELAHRRMELGNAEYPAFKLEVSDLEFAVVNDSFM